MSAILKVNGLAAGYKGLTVIRDICLEVNEGEVVALIGANGAGKTTILKSISGLLRPVAGENWFLQKRIDSLHTYEIARLGLILVPEGKKLFSTMSVMENLEVSGRMQATKENMENNLKKIFTLFPVLENRRSQAAGKLSGGEQTMLSIARGLMAGPKLFMLDEPSLGLAPMITAEVFKKLRQICAEGLSVMLSEQNVRQALSISTRGYVLELGNIKLSGPSENLMREDSIRRAYLGL